MIVVRFIGGLGNQLFEYAFGRRMALARGVSLRFDLDTYQSDRLRRFELNRFNIQGEAASPLALSLLRMHGRGRRALYRRLTSRLPVPLRWAYEEEHHGQFDPMVDRLGRNVYVFGLWHSYRYAESIAAALRQELTFKAPPDAANHALGQSIASVNAVSLHIRRGDYLTDPAGVERLGVLPLLYYERAIRWMNERVSAPHYFVFSDEPAWARANLAIDAPVTYVDHNDLDHGYEDLRLMSLCRHHIIANSTFSWWGAWLAEHPDQQVAAPTPWEQLVPSAQHDLYPPRWQRIVTR